MISLDQVGQAFLLVGASSPTITDFPFVIGGFNLEVKHKKTASVAFSHSHLASAR
jgi:hypothetical protein